MGLNLHLPKENLREKLVGLDSLKNRTKNLLRSLKVHDNGQLQHTVVWKDLVAPLSSAGVPASSAPTKAAFGPGGTRDEFKFATGDYVFVDAFHINHDIAPGALAYPHVHWSTDGTSIAPVAWKFEIMRAKGHGQEPFQAPEEYYVMQAASGTAWQHMISEVGDHSATGDSGDPSYPFPTTPLILTEPDELILVTLKRVTNTEATGIILGDNLDDVFGITVDMHYQASYVGTINKIPDFYK